MLVGCCEPVFISCSVFNERNHELIRGCYLATTVNDHSTLQGNRQLHDVSVITLHRRRTYHRTRVAESPHITVIRREDIGVA